MIVEFHLKCIHFWPQKQNISLLAFSHAKYRRISALDQVITNPQNCLKKVAERNMRTEEEEDIMKFSEFHLGCCGLMSVDYLFRQCAKILVISRVSEQVNNSLPDAIHEGALLNVFMLFISRKHLSQLNQRLRGFMASASFPLLNSILKYTHKNPQRIKKQTNF